MLSLSQIWFVLSNAKDVDSFLRSPTSFDVLSSRSSSREFITFVCTLQFFLLCREIKTPMKILRECKFLYLLHAKMLSFRRDHTFLLRSKRAIVQVVYLSLQATILIYRETKTHRKTLDCWSIFILVKFKKLSVFKTLHLFEDWGCDCKVSEFNADLHATVSPCSPCNKHQYQDLKGVDFARTCTAE